MNDFHSFCSLSTYILSREDVLLGLGKLQSWTRTGTGIKQVHGCADVPGRHRTSCNSWGWRNHSCNKYIQCIRISLMDKLIFTFLETYFWLHWVFIAASRFFLIVASRVCSLVVVHGLNTCGLQALRERRLSSCGTRAQLSHVWSSQTRDWTCVPCIARRFLTTGPPGKPHNEFFFFFFTIWVFR